MTVVGKLHVWLLLMTPRLTIQQDPSLFYQNMANFMPQDFQNYDQNALMSGADFSNMGNFADMYGNTEFGRADESNYFPPDYSAKLDTRRFTDYENEDDVYKNKCPTCYNNDCTKCQPQDQSNTIFVPYPLIVPTMTYTDVKVDSHTNADGQAPAATVGNDENENTQLRNKENVKDKAKITIARPKPAKTPPNARTQEKRKFATIPIPNSMTVKLMSEFHEQQNTKKQMGTYPLRRVDKSIYDQHKNE